MLNISISIASICVVIRSLQNLATKFHVNWFKLLLNGNHISLKKFSQALSTVWLITCIGGEF